MRRLKNGDHVLILNNIDGGDKVIETRQLFTDMGCFVDEVCECILYETWVELDQLAVATFPRPRLTHTNNNKYPCVDPSYNVRS